MSKLTKQQKKEIKVLKESEFEFEREMALILEQDSSYPFEPQLFPRHIIGIIYETIMATNKAAEKTIADLEGAYNNYLIEKFGPAEEQHPAEVIKKFEEDMEDTLDATPIVTKRKGKGRHKGATK